jgi:hypothetical protein
MLRWIGIAFALALGCVAVGAIVVFGLKSSREPPEVWKNPPIYPGAQQLQIQDFGTPGKIDENAAAPADAVHIMKVIRFTVAEKPEKIRLFYERAFTHGGMRPDNWGRVTVGRKELNYSWTSGSRSPSDYFIDLVIKEESIDKTVIEIGISMFPGY